MANLLFPIEEEQVVNNGPVTCLGIQFENDTKRREFFRDELRKKLPELRLVEGFPIGTDDDIIALSDPPYYTACPNPWINDFIKIWEKEKNTLANNGTRDESLLSTTPYASDVSEGKKNAVYGAHSYHTKVPHPAIMRYLMHYTQPGDIILDGFAGTGMTGVACQMMDAPEESVRAAIENEFRLQGNERVISWGKRNCICSDLSPLASFIAYNYTNNVNKKLFAKEFEEILEDLKAECEWMYQTKHTDGSLGTIDYVVWSEVFCCPDCGEEIVFYNDAVNESGDVKKDIICPHCGATHGKRELVRASETIFDKSLDDTITRSKYLPVLIVYTDRFGKERTKAPDAEDLQLISKIEKEDIPSWFPTTRMPEGGESRRNDKYGITHVHHFYIKRSLRTLSYLYDRISNCQPEWKAVFMSIITALSKQQRYRANSGFPNMILSGTLYIGSMIREWNPISWFQGKVKGIKRLLQIDYRLDNSVLVQTQSSTQLPIADCSVDYIFTDPPFGSNLMYSELNFCQESWLKVLTNNKEEAIENASQNKYLPEYQSLMTRCFSEFYRILKYGKWMTVEFSNTSSAVWNCIQNSLTRAGFVITSVAALDKKQISYKAIVSTVAVKEDLVISCYKPSEKLTREFSLSNQAEENIWDFTEELISRLPVHLRYENSTTSIIERSPKILYDRLIAYYVQHGYQVPIDAIDFQKGLKEHFVERDGMYFTAEQAIEYEDKKRDTSSFVSLALLVGSEEEGIEWLKRKLEDSPKTYSEILPDWMHDLVQPRKGDELPELMQILEENFLRDENGCWYVPDVNDQAQLEAVKLRRLLREFEVYIEARKIRNARLEALRAGFKECYKNKDFATIVSVGDKLPEELLTTDEILWRYYDIASSRV